MEPSLPFPPCVSEMELHPPVNETEITAPSIWDWGDLLDFSVDDHFSFSLTDATTTVDSTTAIITPEPAVIAKTTTTTATQVSDRVALDSTTAIIPPETTKTPAVIATTTTTTATQVSDRVRKRDPRMTCSNFLAGRVPCACPEMDEQLRLEEEEEAEAVPGKKRARVARTGSGAVRCQVPGCGADISELKGYHKRHRVCLRCANASAVVVDGENKRYCQQCGKFHVLSDFDEGKRSCRMKLQRHNIIRRRKQPLDSSKGGVAEKESQGDLPFQVEENVCNAEEARKGEVFEKEALVESDDGRALTDPNSQSRNSDSCETLMDGGKDDSKFSFSPSNYENKSAYVPACPTGRISFKLYDWNPAEFPRRLRHQIFQWLASMPVELEGYIRPGCTILTAFIAMPTFMWAKLFEDPVSHLHDILACGKVLSKRGPMVVYLNNRIFHVMKDGITIMKVDMKARAPRLHYVHPICFEAGKPIEILACGSNLLQPKFQFLLSFAGKYLAQDYCVALPGLHDNGGCSFDHQLCKILIPQIEPNLLGPAFIEVENESGLSNFIPVLIADAEICSELKSIQQRFGLSNLSNSSQCEVSALKQKSFAEFLVDIAWLLKDPSSEDFPQILTSSQIQRLSYLLEFLLHYESTTILERVFLQKLKIMIDKMEINSKVNGCSSDVEMSLLQRKMDHARNILYEKKAKNESLYTVRERDCLPGSYSEMGIPSVALPSEDLEDQSNGQSGAMASSSSSVRSEKVPLLNQELVMNVNHIKGLPSKSCNPVASYRVGKSRHTLFVVAAFAVCFAVCTVLLHPHKVSRFAVTIRRCLTDRF